MTRRPIDWPRRSAYGLLAVCVVFLGFVAKGARDTAQQFEAERRERALGACVQDNVSIERARVASVESTVEFAHVLGIVDDPDNLTPEQEAGRDQIAARMELVLPFRDCSSDGIDQYLDDPPPDPALEEGP
jgi:hypothetical protein